MPYFSASQLFSLPVKTKSGVYLGKVRSFDWDTESFLILRLYVRPRGWRYFFSRRELVINCRQIVAVQREAIIVDDLWEGEEFASAKEVKIGGSCP